MMAALYDVSIPSINQHIKTIFNDGELIPDSVIKEYLTTAADGKKYTTKHYNLHHEQAKLHAESEYEKYRLIQDRVFASDFDKEIKRITEKSEDEE